MNRQRVSFTTSAGGAATAAFPHSFYGAKLYAVLWTKGTCDAGVDISLATSGADGSTTVFADVDANSSIAYYPRVAANATADASALTWYDLPVLDGILTLTIAQGGNAKSGSMVVLYED